MNAATTPAQYDADRRGTARRLLFKICAALMFSLAMVAIGGLL